MWRASLLRLSMPGRDQWHMACPRCVRNITALIQIQCLKTGISAFSERLVREGANHETNDRKSGVQRKVRSLQRAVPPEDGRSPQWPGSEARQGARRLSLAHP